MVQGGEGEIPAEQLVELSTLTRLNDHVVTALRRQLCHPYCLVSCGTRVSRSSVRRIQRRDVSSNAW
jgi:hypothetical protein